MNTVQILVASKALIATPNTLTAGSYARDSSDGWCKADGPEAVKWCMSGAVRRVTGEVNDWRDTVAYQLLQDVVKKYPAEYTTIPWFNDTRSHAEIMAVFDEAITIAKRMGA